MTFLALSNFLWSALSDDGATTSASLGPEVGIEREMSWRDVPLFKVFIDSFRISFSLSLLLEHKVKKKILCHKLFSHFVA